MAIRKIIKDDDEMLRYKSREVTEFNEKLWTLLDDMRETMYKAAGVGLAAPQVAILKRIAIIDADDGEGVIELINPEITCADGSEIKVEGCLSVENRHGEVERPTKVTVKYMDRNGDEQQKILEGLAARAACHEIDHLNGILFLDKMIRETE